MTSILPSPSDHLEMPKRMVGRRLVRACSCGKPWPCDQAQWNRLREEIRQLRATEYDLAGDHAELGHDGPSERAYGAVDALDGVLALMDRMETDR